MCGMCERGEVLLEIICLGRNGAALAALGEMVVLAGLSVLLTSLGDRNEGVKLGLSTLKDFFDWLPNIVNNHGSALVRSTYLSPLVPSTDAAFSTLWLNAQPGIL